MKNLREMTEEQILEISRMALSEVLLWLLLQTGFVSKEEDFKFRIEHEVWSKEPDKTEFIVIRAYLQQLNTELERFYVQIWENAPDEFEEHDRIEVNVIADGEDKHCSNIVGIAKKLIKWEFV